MHLENIMFLKKKLKGFISMKNGEYILVKAPPNFPGKKYRNKYCYEHHLNYWLKYNILPKDDEIIHHKDGNKHNNNPDNLELLKRSKHSSNHSSKRGITMVTMLCPVCGKQFTRRKKNTHLSKTKVKYTCCSRNCSAKLSSNPPQAHSETIILKEFKIYQNN